MKKLCYAIILPLLAAVLCINASAYTYYGGMLSPALTNISEDVTLIKSGLIATDIGFSADDFVHVLGKGFESITLTALPPESSGKLTLDGNPVSINQQISAVSLSKLRFTPSKETKEASFRFKSGGEYSLCCIMRSIDSVNMAPVVNVVQAGTKLTSQGVGSIWTQRDITVYGTLSVSDPEGDELTFEITKYPENGILKLVNVTHGDYCYTPCDGVTGEDTFSYVVRDEWGNYSEEASVVVKIDKTASDVVFADMDEHWAHNAALVMVAEQSMDAECMAGEIYFRPDEIMTRENFLVTVMKALGAGDIEPCSTVFADNAEISSAATGYINRAYELGVIKGIDNDGMLCFKPDLPVTRAEAAVILNSIIGASEPDVVPVFADNQSVPAWAKSAIYALTDAGIFTGTGSGNISPNSQLNKAQTAQMLLTIKNYLKRQ